jgi:prophage DNA circulation protein
MANEEQILQGFFRNIPISINSGSVDGGRKTSIKQFPNRDTQNVEDLGLQPRKYTLEIIVAQKNNQSYFGYRDSLLAALETKEPGVLIHPLYGRIEEVVAVSYSLSESFDSFGDTTVSVNFEVTENVGIPQQSSNVRSQIAAANELVKTNISTDISENFSVTNSFTGNFSSAVDKVNGIIDRTLSATSFIGETSDTLNEFSSEIGQLSANVNSLVSDPIALADSITNLFNNVNGLYASSSAAFDTFTGFFNFGNDDVEIVTNTAGKIERDQNNKVLNGSVAASALSYSYLAITDIDFETTRQIDELSAELDDQYNLVQNSGSSQDVKDAITDMRIKTLASLEEVRVNTNQIISVETNPTSTRLLGFNYYGNDEFGETISELNSISDVSFIEGNVEVLTA